MGSETAPRADVRLTEFADGPFRGSNVHQNVGLRVCLREQSVVRLLPRYLQFDERLGEVRISTGNSRIARTSRHAFLTLPCSTARYTRCHAEVRCRPMNRSAAVAAKQWNTA